jgi:WD40 repeat protein
MPGHFASVNRVAWSPDGKLISTGGFDGEVRVRKPAVSSNNTNFSQTVTLYRGHRAGIHNLVWSRTGKLIASGDLYGEIHVWQALTGEPVARVKRKSQVVTLNPYDWLGGITLYQFDRSGRICYYYAHLQRYADNLHEGDTVSQGQVIGYVGTTGNAPPNTPHLHFAVFEVGDSRTWWKGRAIDPYPLLKDKGRG